MSTLYIVATPIGNLKDISLRALEVFKEVDLILAEDTRVTKKLLNHYRIKTPVSTYHQHSKIQKINYIIDLLKEGNNLALVSDAGTPGISDPGNKLIQKLTEDGPLQVKFVPVPGPSALTAAASASGFPVDRFLFLGFLPVKKKRKKMFERIKNSEYPVIFYESPHRIIKTLKELQTYITLYRSVVVYRELTKKFETIYRGKIEKVIKEIENYPVKGEFVVIVSGEKQKPNLLKID